MTEHYNGYSNYATWKANLEFFSELCIEDLATDFKKCSFTSEFADVLKNLFIEYCYFEDDHKDIVKSAINYFINDINFEELASMYAEELQ